MLDRAARIVVIAFEVFARSPSSETLQLVGGLASAPATWQLREGCRSCSHLPTEGCGNLPAGM